MFRNIQNEIAKLFLTKDDSPANHLAVAKELNQVGDLPPYFRKLRVAFLSNFTLLGLPEIFKVRAIFHNIWAETYLAPYNQYAQEVLNPDSGLNKFKPELVYFLIDFSDADSKQVNELAEAVKSNLETEPVVISNFSDFKAYWYTKYKELGDLRLAPEAFSALSDKLLFNAVASSGAIKKCLVMDLDNTLWKGVVGEDGFDGIKPDTELQKYILSLYERGVILAVNSKNNLEDALEVFERHPQMILRKNHLAAWRINWEDKAKNLEELAEELNFGLDSFVLVDDDPFQLTRIQSVFPEVAAISPDQLKDYPGFHSFYLTEEDKRRGAMYAEEQSRKEFRTSLASVDDFLKSLNLKLEIKLADISSVSRVAQLIQRTNQFNMTTRRYTEEEIKQILKEGAGRGGWLVATAKAVDRFGDYGIIGIAMLKKTESNVWHLNNLMMSCRILGRGLERAFLAYFLNKGKESGVKKIIGEFIPSKKNKSAENFYLENGFVSVGQDGESRLFEYDLSKPFRYPEHIEAYEDR